MSPTLVQKVYLLAATTGRWDGLWRHIARVVDVHANRWMGLNLSGKTLLIPVVACLIPTHRCSTNKRDLLLLDMLTYINSTSYAEKCLQLRYRTYVPLDNHWFRFQRNYWTHVGQSRAVTRTGSRFQLPVKFLFALGSCSSKWSCKTTAAENTLKYI